MKKFFVLCAALILMIGISCEKEKEIKLSEYVIGEWDSQELNLGETPVIFKVHINTDGRYVLSLTDGTNAIICPEAGYTVDNENSTITIDQPDFDPNDGLTPTETQTFDVTWVEGSDVMTWIPDNSGGGDAPTIVWTRQ
jgi:hypothetical protein